MHRHLIISLGYQTKEGMCLLSYYEDFAFPNRSRFMKKGHFDVDRWEAAQKHIFMRPGADPRAAWKEAWRFVRTLVRAGKDATRQPNGRGEGTRRISCLTGYEFEATCNDDPRRLP